MNNDRLDEGNGSDNKGSMRGATIDVTGFSGDVTIVAMTGEKMMTKVKIV